MVDKTSFYDIDGTSPDESNNVKQSASNRSVAEDTRVKASPFATKTTQGEINMAEVDTTQLSAEHGAIRHDIAVESARLGNLIGSEACGINTHIGDSRREQEKGFADIRYNVATNSGDIRREIANEHCKTNDVVRAEGQENVMAIKDARHDVLQGVDAAKDFLSTQTEGQADRTVDRISESRSVITDRINDLRGMMGDRFFAVGRDLATLEQGHATLGKDIELNALKTQLDAKENTRYITDKIVADGEKTRALINDLKYHDLNRGLVERNTELVNCEQDRRYYRDRWDDGRFNQLQAQFAGQWAQLQSQVQAFQSQLQETRQGMVNFGTMAGVGQSSTSNNVR